MSLLPGLLPIIAAPMAGGPSTTALVAAVGGVGALGFLPGGYITPDALDRDLTELERITDHPYGVNLFLPSPQIEDLGPAQAYAGLLAPVADAVGVELGPLRWDDDAIDAKLEVLAAHRPAAVSFTFGLPSEQAGEAVRAAGALVVATVTTAGEAAAAAARGVDAIIAQGAEAGGHRGVLHDDGVSAGGGELVGRRDLLRQVRDVTALPLIAAGGIVHGADIQDALDLGAVAAALGTAFLCCPEAGTSATHRRAVLDRRFPGTVVTRAFTGRPARGLRNEFAERFTAVAPPAYPQIHHLTRPLRAAAARDGDPQNLHLWAGTGWNEVTEEPAAALVARLERERAAAARSAG